MAPQPATASTKAHLVDEFPPNGGPCETDRSKTGAQLEHIVGRMEHDEYSARYYE